MCVRVIQCDVRVIDRLFGYVRVLFSGREEERRQGQGAEDDPSKQQVSGECLEAGCLLCMCLCMSVCMHVCVHVCARVYVCVLCVYVNMSCVVQVSMWATVWLQLSILSSWM